MVDAVDVHHGRGVDGGRSARWRHRAGVRGDRRTPSSPRPFRSDPDRLTVGVRGHASAREAGALRGGRGPRPSRPSM
ncbi:hypothetical protein DSY14_12670 [Nocardiopsis sp. MG754419]|nr:hypothetical protein [Nocardiopsis sp. MG754419]